MVLTYFASRSEEPPPGSVQYDAVKCHIVTEITEGNYVVSDVKPELISPLGAIPKSNGGVRLIYDCSQPSGCAVNDYASLGDSHSFQTIDNPTELVQPGYYMDKIYLKSAYHSIRINSESQRFNGLQFPIDGHTVYTHDTKLPFGSRLAPGIFHRLTQAVKCMMAKRGFTAMVVYLDDFSVCLLPYH